MFPLICFLIGNKQIRDQALSRLKSKIELMYVTNGNKRVVVVPHSMGVIYFFHFLKWVESRPPMGGGGGPGWCAKHIKAIMNIGPAFLGVPKAVSNIFSAEGKDVAFIRSVFGIFLFCENSFLLMKIKLGGLEDAFLYYLCVFWLYKIPHFQRILNYVL